MEMKSENRLDKPKNFSLMTFFTTRYLDDFLFKKHEEDSSTKPKGGLLLIKKEKEDKK